MKNVLDLITEFVEEKLQLQSRKKQLRAKVVKTGEAIFLNHVMPAVSNVVRQLIVEKGLNPDYVPPPPAPPAKEEKPRPAWTAPHSYGWEREVIKGKLAKHPVIASRLKLKAEGGLRDKMWERKQEEEKRAQAACVTEEPLQVTEPVTQIDTNALQNLEKFMAEFDALVMEMPKKADKAPRPKRHGRKKSSKKEVPAKVTKNFGGYFRRVSEE